MGRDRLKVVDDHGPSGALPDRDKAIIESMGGGDA